MSRAADSPEAVRPSLQPAQPSVRTQVGRIVASLMDEREQNIRPSWLKYLAEACKEKRLCANKVPLDPPSAIIAFIAATAAPEQVADRERWIAERAKEADAAAQVDTSISNSLSPQRE